MHFIQKNNYILAVLLLCFVFVGIGTLKTNDRVTYEKVVVVEGDTLWGYSVQYAEKMPVEKWIEDVMVVNNLTSSKIQVGEELKLPMKKEMGAHNVATHIAGEEE